MNKTYNESTRHHISQVISNIFNGHFDYYDASSVLSNIEEDENISQNYIKELHRLLSPHKKLSHNLIEKVERHCAKYL